MHINDLSELPSTCTETLVTTSNTTCYRLLKACGLVRLKGSGTCQHCPAITPTPEPTELKQLICC